MSFPRMIQPALPSPSTYQESAQHFIHSHFYPEEGGLHSTQQAPVYNSANLAVTHPNLPYRTSNPPFQRHETLGLGIQFSHPGSVYYLPESQAFNNSPSSLASELPMTPKSTDSDFGGKRDQTVKSEPQPAAASMPKAKAPRPRKARAGKPSATKMEKLSAPLSELTKHMTDIPVRDMEKFVNRSLETRRKEAESRNGYVTRPMNSFMLYRSAYAERTKVWCLHNNHQVVSAVTGESWPLEPEELRQMYMNLANTERINHTAAHPTYKFSPSKAVSPARKRKDSYSSDDEGILFESEESDEEYRPDVRRRQSPHTTQKRRRALTPASTDCGSSYGGYISHQDMNKSSWEAVNEGKPLPAAIGSQDMYQQYFETSIHSTNIPGIEDVRMQRVEPPRHHYAIMPSGLPGMQHPELLQRNTMASYEQVDPSLLGYYDPNCGQEPRFSPTGDDMNPISPNTRYLIEGHPMYSHFCEPDNTASQFEDWMGPHHGPG